ncbi:RHS repeat domain-containing protein [Asanoa siamensis]|uniref:Teneurin-like YD-shell domain-containing protein n=1 Tax=Asanoa siamensis TaxID=926357 RepID=A0ABQ4CQ22_9ACTN|nr:RHS repeat-associated core domain-containing protein [Asanoa siamensis]GIF73371.1 hypothetical protein Asi02nite_28890 [Asanoa siamensis]
MFSRVFLGRRYRRRVVRPVTWLMTAVVSAGILSGLGAPAAAAGGTQAPPAVKEFGETVTGTPQAVKPRRENPVSDARVTKPATVTWPTAGVADLPVTAAVDTTKGGGTARAAAVAPAKVGGMAVGVRAPKATDQRSAQSVPGTVRMEVAPRATSTAVGVDGPVVSVRRTDSARSPQKLSVSLGYGGFADAYGGDYGARLRLVKLPACALTTPTKAQCAAAVPVKSTNDSAADVVTADVDVTADAAVFALAAGDSSAQGNYTATKLAPSSKWNVQPSSGAFNWSYPLRLPPTPGGNVPEVSFNYSSQSVDGRTSATNNQGSWVGEGFNYEPGYIERRYKSCNDDGHETSADQCWSHENATIMLGGQSGELIKDASARWRMTTDTDWKIEPKTGATNGDNNGEYWLVTTPDGQQHTFGLNRLEGWTSGKPETNAAWTVPVFGDDSGEPCYNATFANASCQQAWRWNLDSTRDLHDNVTSFYYARETNYYARNGKTDVNGTEYHRGGYLDRIEYGQKYGAVHTTQAPARVRFSVAERCLVTSTFDCAENKLTEANATHWPDVPADRICAPGTKCKLEQAAPSFFTRKRLTAISTEIRKGTGWDLVDTWALDHWFTDNSDGSKTLWLNQILHTGHVGDGTVALPAIQLIGDQYDNRIDLPNDSIAALMRFRVTTIYTDSGSQIDVTYADPDCSAGNLPSPGSSTRRCYPVKWTPNFGDPVDDWFHKYVVKEVIETDRTGGGPDMVTRYEYVGGAAWRKGDLDGFNKAEDLTWNDWRGYQTVRVTRGDGQTMTTRSDHTFLRGMDGNKLPNGSSQSASVTDSTGTTHTDTDELAGQELETVTYNGSAQVAKVITVPWLHESGKQTNSWGSTRSTYVRPGTIRNLTALAAGGWRETKTVNKYDTTHGRLTEVDDLGDVAGGKDADDRCTRTTYADNAGKWIYSLASRVETVAVKCATGPNRATQVITDVRTWFDGQAYGAAPTIGDPTRTEKLKSHDGTTATYVTEAVSTFDGYGRPKTVADNAGSTTTTTYTETDGLTTRKEEVGPMGSTWKVTTDYAQHWGLPAGQTDLTGQRGEMEYDALGRLVNVWLPDRSRAAGTSPSMKYTYLQRADKPTAVKTEKVNIDGSYVAEWELYDGFLRPRQKQTVGPEGGRLVTDTFYTATGQIGRTNDVYHMAGTPSDVLLVSDNGDANGQTVIEYDGADRAVAEVFRVSGDEKWRTTTIYGGDRVSVDPPTGGVPTTTITDGRGQKTSLLQYTGAGPSGASHETKYTYTAAGQMATLTDPANNVWKWTYDQRGRQIAAEDPDAGKSTSTYDDLDRQLTGTDARGNLITTTYDKIGRKTASYHGTAETGTKVAGWTYDTYYRGQMATSQRIVEGKTYGVAYIGRDYLYRPTRTRYVVPSVAGMEELAGNYEFTSTFNRDDTLQGQTWPAGGGLAAEAVVYDYDAIRRPVSMTSGIGGYVSNVKYAQTGELMQYRLSDGGKWASMTYTYEKGTKRLQSSRLDRQGAPVVDIDARYSYDAAGNVQSIDDNPAGGTRDAQCFTRDGLNRITDAWTSASTAVDPCAGGASTTGVGGPAPYHHSYTYDVTGSRDTETIHGVNGGSDVVRDYSYPAAGQPRAHALGKIVEQTSAGQRLYEYAYDASGNMTTRTQVGVTQTLNWTKEGKLASVVAGGQTQASFEYDADGNRMLRKEPNATTLYLPGMELKLNNATRAVEGTRFYSFAGQTVAVRTVQGVKFLASDHQGSQSAVVDATTGAITRRRMTAFGTERGAPAGAWPGDKGFVGGTMDTTTGLTQLGARLYDPAIGRFISVDPVFTADDPSQLNAYQYGRNNPVTWADPTGLSIPPEDTGRIKTGGGDTPPPDPGDDEGGEGSTATGYVEDPELVKAREDAEKAKQRLINGAKMLGKIAMDELGITAGLDCLTTGDLGACGETALNIAMTFAGGLALKLAKKYGLPWEWGNAARVAKLVKTAGDDIVGGGLSWINKVKRVRQLEERAKGALQQASELAFKAADDPSSIFIKNKHLSTFGGKYAKFDSADISEVQTWVAEGLRSEGAVFKTNGDGSFKMEVDLQRPIGTRGQTGIRIMVNEAGKVFNAFPIKMG